MIAQTEKEDSGFWIQIPVPVPTLIININKTNLSVVVDIVVEVQLSRFGQPECTGDRCL